MQKSTAIQDLCSDLLYHPGIISSEIRDNMCFSAGLIENDIRITQKGYDDWSTHSLIETSHYIREQILFCSKETQDNVFFLLIELPGTEQ